MALSQPTLSTCTDGTVCPSQHYMLLDMAPSQPTLSIRTDGHFPSLHYLLYLHLNMTLPQPPLSAVENDTAPATSICC